MTWWVTRRHSRKPVWTSGKKKARRASVAISIWQTRLIRFTFSHPFPPFSLSLSLAIMFFYRNGRWCDRVAECTQLNANRASPLPGTVYCVFACVSHAIKQEEVRSTVNTRLNARRSAIHHCVSFFGLSVSISFFFVTGRFSHAKSHVCIIELILYDMGIDLTINDRQAIENNYLNSLVCDYEIVWNIWKFIFYKTNRYK